jgi:hypothetical protein
LTYSVFEDFGVSRTGRIILISVAVIALLAVLETAIAFARYAKVEQRFESIQLGDSRVGVIQRIGNPNYYAGKCGVIHSPEKNCVLEYIYSHPLAPIVPDYYVVSFSSDDRVIEAVQLNSP